MRITVDIDDELYAQALRLAGQDLQPLTQLDILAVSG